MELPEVEVMRRDLEKDVVGRKITEAEVRSSKNAMRIIRRHAKRKEFTDRLVGRKIAKVERRGKYLLMPLDNGDVLVVHFGMSGQFVRGTKRVPLAQHTHVVMTFAQGGDLRYIDARTFGEMFVASGDELGKVKELQHIAIDPLDHVFTWNAFGGIVNRERSKCVSPEMMTTSTVTSVPAHIATASQPTVRIRRQSSSATSRTETAATTLAPPGT